MLFDEHLRDAVVQERRREIAEALRHGELDLPRRGLLARWRARRVARSTQPATPAPTILAAPAVASERNGPPLVGIRRTMPDMYR